MVKSGSYRPESRERAVRLVFEKQGEHDIQWITIGSIAAKIGCRSMPWIMQRGNGLTGSPVGNLPRAGLEQIYYRQPEESAMLA